MVSPWGMIRSAVLGPALIISVELAQTCVRAVGTFTAPAVHACSKNEASDNTRTITCAGTGADRRVCMLAARDAPICVVIVAARVKTESLPCVALAVQKRRPVQKPSEALDDIPRVLHTKKGIFHVDYTKGVIYINVC